MNSIVLAILAATSVYRLELTDEKPFIVGEDGVKREVVILDPEEHAALTGKLSQVWSAMNSTEDGRRKLHGKIERTDIDEEAKKKTDVYTDGYCHVTPFEVRKPVEMKKFAAPPKKTRDSRISERHRKMREELAARKAGNVKEVTVEHDAATGKDIVK